MVHYVEVDASRNEPMPKVRSTPEAFFLMRDPEILICDAWMFRRLIPPRHQ